MLSLRVSSNLKEVLNKVTPRFEENLKQGFIYDGVRRERRDANVQYHLDGVLITEANINIELSNLNLLKAPTFNIRDFKIDLDMLNVHIAANLGQLVVEGDLKQSSINTLLPMLKVGRIMFVLEDVMFDANIGIYIEEDSFMACNYDINIKPAKILSKVSCTDGNNIEAYESIETEIDNTLAKHIWPQLQDVFQAEILYSQFGGNIVEQSVSELLLDEPEDMRLISENRSSKVNALVDKLITSMNNYFTASNATTLETPPLVITIFKDKSQCGKLECGKGQFRNLSTFTRNGDMSIYEKNGIQYLHGKIKIRELKFKYDSCKAKYDAATSENGRIEVGAYRSEIFIKLSLQNDGDPADISVDKVEVWKLMDIDFDVFNLDCLSTHQDELKSWVIRSLRGLVFPLLERKIKEALSYAIKHKQS